MKRNVYSSSAAPFTTKNHQRSIRNIRTN